MSPTVHYLQTSESVQPAYHSLPQTPWKKGNLFSPNHSHQGTRPEISGRLIICCPVKPISWYSFKKIFFKYLSNIFVNLGLYFLHKICLKFMWKLKEPRITKTTLKNRRKLKVSYLPISKLNYKVTEIKTGWYWHTDRNIDKWNWIESPEINSCMCHQIIFNKGMRPSNNDIIIFSTNDARTTG